MPRSRSRSLESITRSATASLARKMPLCLSMASTSVVLPWSTCAIMAMLLIESFGLFMGLLRLFLVDGVDRIQPGRDSGRIQAGRHGSEPDQGQRARQQRYRGMKLN